MMHTRKVIGPLLGAAATIAAAQGTTTTAEYLGPGNGLAGGPIEPMANNFIYGDRDVLFVVRVSDGPDCLADVNGDGSLTPGDFNAWVLAFNNQSSGCDQNGDGACTPGDFNAWVLNFNNGCP
ncbi:MAG: GC-type dockerin domain-anchored protein [Planctomycetota bacterium]